MAGYCLDISGSIIRDTMFVFRLLGGLSVLALTLATFRLMLLQIVVGKCCSSAATVKIDCDTQ